MVLSFERESEGLVRRTIPVIVIRIVESVFGAEEQARYDKQGGQDRDR